MPDDETINQMVARSEEEFDLFQANFFIFYTFLVFSQSYLGFVYRMKYFPFIGCLIFDEMFLILSEARRVNMLAY